MQITAKEPVKYGFPCSCPMERIVHEGGHSEHSCNSVIVQVSDQTGHVRGAEHEAPKACKRLLIRRTVRESFATRDERSSIQVRARCTDDGRTYAGETGMAAATVESREGEEKEVPCRTVHGMEYAYIHPGGTHVGCWLFGHRALGSRGRGGEKARRFRCLR